MNRSAAQVSGLKNGALPSTSPSLLGPAMVGGAGVA